MTPRSPVDASLAAGTNVKGSAVGANWRFALPRLPLGTVLHLGRPAPGTLAALAQTAVRVLVLVPARQAAALRADADRAELTGVEVRALEPRDVWPAAGAVELAVVAPAMARRLRRDRALRAALERSLATDGMLWVEARSRRAGAAGDATHWLGPSTGEAQAVAPLRDRTAVRFLRAHARDDSGVRRSLPERARRRVRWCRACELARPRRATLAAPGVRPDEVPRYLAALAAGAGLDLTGWRWALAAPGRYASKKVLCFLAPPGAARPALVVKMTRDPAFNDRLRNERAALLELAGRLGAADGFPEVAFGGTHAGLEAVAETVLGGSPFRRRTTGRADCPLAGAVLDWLVELGAATATPAPPGEVAASCRSMLAAFRTVYASEAPELDALETLAGRIAAARAPVPLVFQHGDPGPWNILATGRNTVAFLDWEAAEPAGMPLWDLFYFARSYGQAAGHGPGVFGDAALDRLLATAVLRFCERSALDPALIEPLFHLCWVHRALKEAARLPRERLGSSRYLALGRRYLARRGDPALAAVLAPTESVPHCRYTI